MHFDLAHAIVTVLLVFGTIYVPEMAGVAEKGQKRKFSSIAFGVIALVVFILNLVWLYGL